jgi:hypothetical protein
MEDKMSRTCIDNSIYVKASRLFNEYSQKSSDDVYPYSLMSKPVYVKKTGIPIKPIMIMRTSTSIMMKLPNFRPITEYKAWRDIEQMALFGKPSGSGVAVSLNNTEYDGTGQKVRPGATVTITGLTPNEKYVFASAGYAKDQVCVNGIGETTDDIITLLPLSLPILYGYLATTAYKLKQFQIAKTVSEALCSQVIEKNEIRCSLIDSRINPILAFKLKYDYIKVLSIPELQQIAESFVVLARCAKTMDKQVAD